MNPLLFSFLISIGLQAMLFIPAFFFKTDKLTDISYALTFLVLAWIYLNDLSVPAEAILLLMISLWALRLGIFLFIRINRIKKDKGFDGIRENLPRFLAFWLLQGISVFIIMLPSIFYLSSRQTLTHYAFAANIIPTAIGFFIWLLGLVIESIADFQKFMFNNKEGNKGRWINSGLWKYSRHPNYFGEILCWLGVYIFVFMHISPIERIIAAISPVYITILLLFVTGIPKLEEAGDGKWGNLPDYQDYKKRTSILIPLPIRKPKQ